MQKKVIIKMTRIILVRHGKSVANDENLFAGHLDVDLHETGAAQARLTAEYIAENFKVDGVVASDLKRAFFTGKIIADRLGAEITPDKGFREVDAGEWDGMNFDDLPRLFPEDFAMWRSDIGNSRCTGGETVKELYDRILDSLGRVALENEGKTLVVASHATPIRCIATALIYGDVHEMNKVAWPTNASVTVVTLEGGKWTLEKYSEDEHLASQRSALPDSV